MTMYMSIDRINSSFLSSVTYLNFKDNSKLEYANYGELIKINNTLWRPRFCAKANSGYNAFHFAPEKRIYTSCRIAKMR
jgi:hypothetical protein